MSARTLLYDIETAPNLAYVWAKYEQDVLAYENEWYMLCFSYLWLEEDDEATVVALPDFRKPYKEDPTNDYYVVEKLHQLFSAADIVVGHNCVEVSTPVLTTDLIWVPAGDLKLDDHLVGFEEDHQPKRARHLRDATVTHHEVAERECMRVIFDNGDEIVTTPEHPWLKLAANGREYRWCLTSRLKVGQRVERFVQPWVPDRSYEAGWMSGFIAGEGTIKRDARGTVSSLDFCQRPGVTWDQALHYTDVLEIPLGTKRSGGYTKSGGLGRQDTLYTYTTGGKWTTMDVLGRLQIRRLIDKIDWNHMGALKGNYGSTATIIAIEPAGVHEVALMSTSTQTYLAAGYPMHNSNSFDNRKSNARFLVHGMDPPEPYRAVDTCLVARKYFSLNSNKLGDLGETLGIGTKAETHGFSTWLGCMQGSRESWEIMREYNARDTELLRDVYLRLRPWIQNHPNITMYEGDLDACPRCGEDALTKQGLKRNKTTTVQQWKCSACGGWASSRLSERVDPPTFVAS